MIAEVVLSPIGTRKLSSEVYEQLREKIISQEFAPGQRLDLNAIEQQLAISRTPLKEALARLETEGLVEISPRRGTFVTNPQPEAIAESFATRLAVESYAAEMAAEMASDHALAELAALVRQLGALATQPDRMAAYPRFLELDFEFHTQLVGLLGNQRLSAVHQRENVHAQMARLGYKRAERELEVDEAQKEHEELMAALIQRDGARARQVLRAHLDRAIQWALNDLNRHSSAGRRPGTWSGSGSGPGQRL